MTVTAEAKIVQVLGEAHASEKAWSQILAGHIAMTPTGSYRDILERQRNEADRHAQRVQQRLSALGDRRGLLGTGIGVVTALFGQAVGASKVPFDLLLGGCNGEEKMLNNAKDETAALQHAIVSYRALVHLTEAVGDTTTGQLADSILTDKEKGLHNLEGAIDGLVDSVIRSDIRGKKTYDPSTTGAAQAGRRLVDDVDEVAETVGDKVRTQAKQARKIPGVARAEGEIKGAVADVGDLRIANYDELTAEDINRQLGPLSQIDLAKIDAYERKNDNRSTVTGRITSLRGDEPWPGYDEQTVVEIRKLLDVANDDLARKVSDYERRHKDRQGVLDATESALASS